MGRIMQEMDSTDFTARFRTEKALWNEWGSYVGERARSELLAAFLRAEVERERQLRGTQALAPGSYTLGISDVTSQEEWVPAPKTFDELTEEMSAHVDPKGREALAAFIAQHGGKVSEKG